jgi:hypothetical protein
MVDWWSGSGPLHTRFPCLFSGCMSHFTTVHDARVLEGVPGEWRIGFRCQLGMADRVKWDNLCREVHALPSFHRGGFCIMVPGTIRMFLR